MIRKQLLEVYPEPVEYPIDQVSMPLHDSPLSHEMLKAEVGAMLLGEAYDPYTHSNPHLTARQAGELGGHVNRYKRFKLTNNNKQIEALKQKWVDGGKI